MERLTEWSDPLHKHAYYPRCFEDPCSGEGCNIKDCPFETAVCDRLAAYEDIAELCGGADRLRALAEADKDGRCVVLPCKVYETDGARVYEHTVREVIYETAGGPAFDKNAIGKSIFLTRAEAERAMQEMEGRKDG